jgi:glycosyltransferase involved in cell wall biosynthesis
MNFALFGLYGVFDYFRIGGLESFNRRLAGGLARLGHQVDFILYGAPNSDFKLVDDNISVHHSEDLSKALQFLVQEQRYDHVITFYLPPADRLRYLYFRFLYRHKLCFHQIYFNWPDSPLKRKGMFVDARLYPFNGRLFCISPRQFNVARQWCPRATLLFPPVPESYFVEPDAKPKHEKVQVTYIGRTEANKGIEAVLQLAAFLQDCPQVEVAIHGFHHKTLPASVKTHEWLSQQQEIRYVYTPFEGYSPALEDNLRQTLKNTDILLLPYRKLSSTIDTPLLLLEGMASLCAIVTHKLGNIPDIYGPGPFLLDESADITGIGEKIKSAPGLLDQERQRIYHQNQLLGFKLNNTVERLVDALSTD